MALVTLQVGQCGNQVGSRFFSAVSEAASNGEAGMDSFFREADSRSQPAQRARAVLVDMEAKVIAATVRSCAAASASGSDGTKRLEWTYDIRQSFYQQSGCGNNWAAGFCTYAPRFCNSITELIRREVEACDYFGGFLLLQSLAGGTGSGLGAAISEAVREEFPSSFLFNHSIWPYESGEVTVQSYNTALSLSHAAEHSDGVVLVENEVLHRTCQALLGIRSPSFQDLNGVAARGLAAALLPAALHRAGSVSACGGRGGGGIRLLSDLVEHLNCHPSYPILSNLTVPQIPSHSMSFTTFSWPAILKRLRQMLLTGCKVEEGINWGINLDKADRSQIKKSLGNYLVLRGQGASAADISSFEDPRLYCPLACQPLMVATSPNRLGGCEMTASLLSNSQACLEPVSRTLDKAYRMYASKAFTHQYIQHGLGLQDFEAAFSRIEDLLCRYRAM